MLQKAIIVFCLLLLSQVHSQDLATIDSLEQAVGQQQREQKGRRLTISDSVAVKTLNALARAYRDFEPDQCTLHASKALALAKKINYLHGQAFSHCLLGNVQNNKGNFNLGIGHFQQSIALCKRIPHQLLLADSQLLLGQSYLYLNNFPEALKSIQAALSGYEKLGKTIHICRALNNLGILYMKQDKYDEVLRIYFKALAILKTLPANQESALLANTINGNVAHVYSEQHKPRQALEILLRCLPVDLKFNRLNSAGLHYQAIGTNYLELGENQKAFEALTKALDLFDRMNNKSGQGDALRYLGQFYAKTNNLPKAIDFTKKGLALSTQIGELESIEFGYENLAKLYAKSGKFDLAYDSHVAYKKYSDSILNSETGKKLIQLQLTNAFEKKEAAIKKEQARKDALRNIADKKQEKIKYIVLTSMFLLSLLTIGIYRNLKNHQKQRQIIQKQKELIEASLVEKETLLREIHHRVKNNLQIITSLLNMQTQEINDPAVLASIQEGQSRVQAMSLIHQNLYQSEEINKVDVENYLKELVDYLSKMFEGNSKNIEVYIETVRIRFDFDTAIPLGLIVNELVSNAFKYGFESKSKGSIHISIRALNDIDYELKVTDDGKGLPAGFDVGSPKTLGLRLVSILSKQLRGGFSAATADKRTVFTVLFKDIKAYNASVD
ncbi:MAG TPA: tetratricopeptide repeat protein [Flavobacterium sp.]|nr:tetratricopeptide repeat protein [Flavobacterium sp.]HPJ10650.1 tetratricopeptide repeat protein [Flavobacterium sp.]